MRCCVHYRQKHILKQMGVMPEEVAVQDVALVLGDLAVSLKSVLGTDWQSLVPHFVELARTYSLPEMPAVDARATSAGRARPTSTRAHLVKFNLSRCARSPMGDARCASSAAGDAQGAARRRGDGAVLGDRRPPAALLRGVGRALRLRGDLYMMVRAVAASVESNPERYKKAPPRAPVDLRDFGGAGRRRRRARRARQRDRRPLCPARGV